MGGFEPTTAIFAQFYLNWTQQYFLFEEYYPNWTQQHFLHDVIQIGHENIFDLQNTFIKSALDYIHSRKGLSWKASLSPLDRNLIRMNAAALLVLADVSNANLSVQIIVNVSLFALYFGW